MRKLLAAHIVALRTMRKLHNVNVYRLKEMIAKLKELENNFPIYKSKNKNEESDNTKSFAKIKKEKTASKKQKIKINSSINKVKESSKKISIDSIKDEVREMMKDLLKMREKRNEIFDSLKKLEDRG